MPLTAIKTNPMMPTTINGPLSRSVKNISPPASNAIASPTTNMTVLRVPSATAKEPP